MFQNRARGRDRSDSRLRNILADALDTIMEQQRTGAEQPSRPSPWSARCFSSQPIPGGAGVRQVIWPGSRPTQSTPSTSTSSSTTSTRRDSSTTGTGAESTGGAQRSQAGVEDRPGLDQLEYWAREGFSNPAFRDPTGRHGYEGLRDLRNVVAGEMAADNRRENEEWEELDELAKLLAAQLKAKIVELYKKKHGE